MQKANSQAIATNQQTYWNINSEKVNRKTRHLAVAKAFITQNINEGIIKVEHIAGVDQLADPQTKGLPEPRHWRLNQSIMDLKREV